MQTYLALDNWMRYNVSCLSLMEKLRYILNKSQVHRSSEIWIYVHSRIFYDSSFELGLTHSLVYEIGAKFLLHSFVLRKIFYPLNVSRNMCNKKYLIKEALWKDNHRRKINGKTNKNHLYSNFSSFHQPFCILIRMSCFSIRLLFQTFDNLVLTASWPCGELFIFKQYTQHFTKR